jgi:hypothetical protein
MWQGSMSTASARSGWLTGAMVASDKILQPQCFITLCGNSCRSHGSRPVTDLRVIKHVSTAFRPNCENDIAPPTLEKELAIHCGIGVHQSRFTCQPLPSLPNAIHVNDQVCDPASMTVPMNTNCALSKPSAGEICSHEQA